MSSLSTVIVYAAFVGVIASAVYFIIKSAVKAALEEFEEEKRYEKN